MPSGSRQWGCADEVCVFTCFCFTLHLSGFFCPHCLFLFPRLLSNPSVAGGGLLRGSHPFVRHYLVVWECCEHPARPLSGCLGGALLALAAAGREGGAGWPRQGCPAPSPGCERRFPAALADAALPPGSRRRCWQPRRIPRIVTQNPRHCGQRGAAWKYVNPQIACGCYFNTRKALWNKLCQYNEITDCITACK